MEKHYDMPKDKRALSDFVAEATADFLYNGGTITKCPTVWAKGSK